MVEVTVFKGENQEFDQGHGVGRVKLAVVGGRLTNKFYVEGALVAFVEAVDGQVAESRVEGNVVGNALILDGADQMELATGTVVRIL